MKASVTEAVQDESSLSATHEGRRLCYENDVVFSEAVFLFDRLQIPRSHLYIEATHSFLDFYVDLDGSLSVEIDDKRDGFWAVAEINRTIGKEIIRIASEGEEFGDCIPTTDQIWGAYGRVALKP